ncbi:UNVERIFIED_CONTAM: type I restriction enzyme S subunit [Acetivibrio alkalicellulosi]
MSYSEWKEVKLGDVYDIRSGLSKDRKEFGYGYPFVSFKDVFYNYFLPDELENLANTSIKERENCSVKKGDVFFTRTSETQDELGMSSVALKDYKNATFNGFTKRLRLKEKIKEDIDLLYIGYYLRSPFIRNQINGFSSMTTRASLNNSMINVLEIKLPPIQEQVKIGEVLRSLDEKIEINNKIINTLETMAQELFKHWFVDFEFPNENGEPYKSSGGEMIESELGLIPKGWEVNTIGQITRITRGASPRPIQNFIKTEGVPWVKISDATSSISMYISKTSEFIKIEGVSKSRKVTPGTLILSNSATPGIPKIMMIEACVHDGWLIFNDYIYLPKEYMYYLLLIERDNILSLSNGSVFRNLKTDILKSYKIIIPPMKLIDNILSSLKAINKNIECKATEMEKLSKIRDTLLPKLMSGEIRVPLNF